MDTRIGKNVLWGVPATVGLYLISTFFPLMGVVLIFLTPLPLLAIRVMHGRPGAVICAALSFVLAGAILVFAAEGGGIMLFLELIFMALVMGELWGRRLPMEKVVAYTVAVSMGFSLVLLVAASVPRGMGPVEMVQADLKQNAQRSLEVYRAMGMPVEKEKDFSELAQHMAGKLLEIAPALMVMGAAILVWANLLLCNRMVVVGRRKEPGRWGDLTRWQAPESLVWVLVGSGFAILIPWHVASVVAINVLLVMVLVYFFQGMSIVVFYFRKKGIPPFVRWLMYGLIAIQQIITVLVIALGLFDMWLDFRRLRHKPA